jgi:hypothetical protein
MPQSLNLVTPSPTPARFSKVLVRSTPQSGTFAALAQDQSLSSQFEAGRLFGEVLLDVLSLIGGGIVAVKAASKIPRLAKLARGSIRRGLKRGSQAGAPSAAPSAPPTTPSQLRAPAPPEPAPPRAPVKSATELQLDEMYRKAPAAKREIDALAGEIAQQTGGRVAKAPLEGRDRALEKAITIMAATHQG